MDDLTTPSGQFESPEQAEQPEAAEPTAQDEQGAWQGMWQGAWQGDAPSDAGQAVNADMPAGASTRPLAPSAPVDPIGPIEPIAPWADEPTAPVDPIALWTDEPTAPTPLSDEPTLVMSMPSSASSASTWPAGAPAEPSEGFARRLRANREARRGDSKSGGKRHLGRRAALISLALLVILGIPALVGLLSAVHDYTTLKGLGESGIAHLLAVKGDLTGQSSSSGNSSSSVSLGSLTGGSGTTAALLNSIKTLLETPGPDVTGPAYTYLAQRQSGTFYPLKVTVQPAKGVASEGASASNFQTTLDTNTYFSVGGQPIPTPTATATGPTPTTKATTAATSAPTATPTTSGTTTAKKSSLIPDPARVAAATQDLRAAQSDFQTLGAQLAHPDVTLALASMLPVAGSDIHAAQTLAAVGVDVTQAGLALLGAATPLLTRLHGATSLLSGNAKLITSSDITALQQAMTVAAARLDDASHRLSAVNVSALPLSAHQKALFAQVEPLLPQVNTLLPQASNLVGVAGWVLGVDKPRSFLVQTLDRGEMRATGGFTGQYGVLTLDDGKLAPFSLQDVNCLDYLTGCLSNGWIFGRRPPAPYNSWWPFGNWGLRDSNLSADFPTDAKLVTDVYYHESGQHVDGLIDVSPIAIEDVLRITGPIQVPLYNETITADNLEAKLHYYQQDPAAIAKEKQLSAGDNSTSSRKRFTQLVGQLLQERVKSLPMSELAPLAERMLLDMRSKDLEVYFTDPQAEGLLTQLHVDGSVNTKPGTDGFLLVQSNVSVSKATNFVKMTQEDDVTLDTKGGATHHLTLTFSANYTYNQVYGYLTYRDYLRIYTPTQSKLLGGDGFDSGKPLCWGPYDSSSSGSSSSSSSSAGSSSAGPTPTTTPTATPTPPPTPTTPAQFGNVGPCSSDPYPHGELVCPPGDYQPGPQAPNEFGSNGYLPWANDKLGGPTNTTSDLSDRAMFAGYVVVPDHCTAKVTLSWYTPNVAPKG